MINAKQDIFVIYEGITEEKFLKLLSSHYESKYNIILINADGKDKILRKYKQKRKTHNFSKFVLMFDLDNQDTLSSIKKLFRDAGVDLTNTQIFFVNPKFELILLLAKKDNPNLQKLYKEIEKVYDIQEYRKKEKQLDKIIKQINENDLTKLFIRLNNINKDDTCTKSTNYLELFKLLYKII